MWILLRIGVTMYDCIKLHIVYTSIHMHNNYHYEQDSEIKKLIDKN